MANAIVSGNCVREQFSLPLRKARLLRKIGTTPLSRIDGEADGASKRSNLTSTTKGGTALEFSSSLYSTGHPLNAMNRANGAVDQAHVGLHVLCEHDPRDEDHRGLLLEIARGCSFHILGPVASVVHNHLITRLVKTLKVREVVGVDLGNCEGRCVRHRQRLWLRLPVLSRSGGSTTAASAHWLGCCDTGPPTHP
ncbi:hypothetical protein N657DRAFT_711533 [Parathielavia appendiculata]|uniref:Uncharacterized protein n=1 Tax=Parathielavia appendiculata TaxID=2587402 RepID=A0AAN6TQN0_9PEZI|nr:hypothetical protein N657DRAFT_711533 [Parathielavia appendiculata]